MSASENILTASVLTAAFGERAAQTITPQPKLKPKRPSPLSVRLSFEERAQLERDAGGLPLSSYIKGRLFDSSAKPLKRRRKSPVEDNAALARALNVLRHSNLGASMQALANAASNGRSRFTREQRKQVEQACDDIAAMRSAILEALGHPDMRA
ncbi:MAG: hypothetical protein AAFV62_02035 [Pseudomonadota bacterium]